MDSNMLLSVAEKLNIPVYDYCTTNKKAFTAMGSIAIDSSRVESVREYKSLLAEELGHCITKSLYPLDYCCDATKAIQISKAEQKATDYALSLQVPLLELKYAISKNTNDLEIAEELDVDVDTLRNAVEYYKRKNIL